MTIRCCFRVSRSGVKTNLPVCAMLCAFCLLFAAPAAHAQLYVFSGSDFGATPPGPWTNSDARAAAFDSAALALGPESLITFESAPVGPFTSLVVAPGVTLTGSSSNSLPQTIQNTPAGSPDNLTGFNTTAGGTHYVYMVGGHLTFTFTTPVNSFGAYLSGVEGLGEAIEVSGSPQSVTLNLFGLSGGGGGVQFVGFTYPGHLISSVTLTANDDLIGVDDVRFATTIPEPATWLLVMLGAGALLWNRVPHRPSL